MIFFSRKYLLNKVIYCSTIAMIVIFIASCSPKNYPHNKPFVYENKVELNGEISKDEKKLMLAELESYWDDSLKARRVTKFPFVQQLINPPVFDTTNITRTKHFMNAYLNTKGFYYANLNNVKIDTTVKQLQQRVKVTIKIELGKNIKIDSVSYALVDTLNKTSKDSAIQNLALEVFRESFLKKGEAYTKQKISDELDRLVNYFRRNGYYKFTREHIYALVDTTNEKLLKLTLDPIELAKLIDEAEKKRKQNPEWDISIKQRNTGDSERLNQFFVSHIYFYPETKITQIPDSLISANWQKTSTNNKGDITVRDYKGKFTLRPMREHLLLRKDSLYREDFHYKTINTLSKINSWQQIDARIVQTATDSLDIHYFLVPQKKYQTNYNIEGSLNYGDFTAGNLVGISANATLNNRNVWKQAIQSSTNLRAVTELNILRKSDASQSNTDLIQTLLFSVGHSYSFPRLIMPKKLRAKSIFRNAEDKRTLIAANAAYTERFEIYRLRSGVLSWGYEGQKNGNFFLWKPFNVELYKIDTLPGLDTLFKANPYLRNSFNDGNVVGLGIGGLNYSKTFYGKKNRLNNHFVRFGFEQSGLLTSFIKPLENKIFKFIKLESEYKFNRKKIKSELAYKFFAGVGIPLGGQSLPFFKQYFAGGPNSMRAWSIKQLGLGSSVLSDTIPATSYRDRLGDMQIESNLEYRFNLINISGYKIASAFFADIGNVWNLKKDATNANAEFSITRLYKDLAIGVGTGLRFDFNYFLIRVDAAYKVKDPGRDYNDGWMRVKDFSWTEKRNNANRTEIKNFAFQLGIGLPF